MNCIGPTIVWKLKLQKTQESTQSKNLLSFCQQCMNTIAINLMQVDIFWYQWIGRPIICCKKWHAYARNISNKIKFKIILYLTMISTSILRQNLVYILLIKILYIFELKPWCIDIAYMPCSPFSSAFICLYRISLLCMFRDFGASMRAWCTVRNSVTMNSAVRRTSLRHKHCTRALRILNRFTQAFSTVYAKRLHMYVYIPACSIKIMLYW